MLLLIDKPKGITSHDVVDIVRRVYKEKRVGHAGTLDPMATGLLIVGVGRESTKLLGSVTKNTKKTYIAKISLGSETDTLDAEGVVTKEAPVPRFSQDELTAVLKSFLGESNQTPPAYSAIKISGKKSYELARGGVSVKLEPRKITIYKIDLLNASSNSFDIEVEVSAGTYIRSLARDIGASLGTVAHPASLRRTAIGEYLVDNARPIEKLVKEE